MSCPRSACRIKTTGETGSHHYRRADEQPHYDQSHDQLQDEEQSGVYAYVQSRFCESAVYM